jgi:hypothetical protein
VPRYIRDTLDLFAVAKGAAVPRTLGPGAGREKIMTETAGWGVPAFLPPAVARRALRDDAAEVREARRAEAERERLAEERHQRALSLAVEQAAQRGEEISAMALATGQVRGRSVEDVLAAASAAADRNDVIAAARLHREGHGDPEPLHVEFGEPVILHARSETGRKIFNRARRFADLLEARRKLAAAEKAAAASRNDYGLVDGVTFRRRSEDTAAAVLARQAEDATRGIHGTGHVSYR